MRFLLSLLTALLLGAPASTLLGQAATSTLTITGEAKGASSCMMEPPAADYEFKTLDIGAPRVLWSPFINRGSASCLMGNVTFTPALPEGVEYQVPHVVPPGEYVGVSLTYDPDAVGALSHEMEIQWHTGRLFTVIKEKVEGKYLVDPLAPDGSIVSP